MTKKVLFWIVLILLAWIFVVPRIPFLHQVPKPSDIQFDDPFPIVSKGTPVVVERKLVLESLQNIGELAGLKGNIEKSYTFEQNRFDTDFNFINAMGKRKCSMTLRGTFKMGFNMEEVTPDKVFVKGTVIEIITPKPILISLELPYDQADVGTYTGILTSPLTDADKQKIYGEARKKIQAEIQAEIENNGELCTQAVDATRESLKSILMCIPNVEKIEFVDFQ